MFREWDLLSNRESRIGSLVMNFLMPGSRANAGPVFFSGPPAKSVNRNEKNGGHAAGPVRSSLAFSQAVGTFKSLPILSVLMSPDRAAA